MKPILFFFFKLNTLRLHPIQTHGILSFRSWITCTGSTEKPCVFNLQMMSIFYAWNTFSFYRISLSMGCCARLAILVLIWIILSNPDLDLGSLPLRESSPKIINSPTSYQPVWISLFTHQRKISQWYLCFLRGLNVVLDPTDFHYMDKNSINFFQSKPLCPTEESYSGLEKQAEEIKL